MVKARIWPHLTLILDRKEDMVMPLRKLKEFLESHKIKYKSWIERRIWSCL
jgi:hypothetical protein